MTVARFFSFSTLVAGTLLAVLSVACGGGDDDDSDLLTTTVAATATQAESPSPSASPTPSNTPTATPTPFDGSVARVKMPRLGIDYPIELVGLTPAGDQLDTPHDATGKIGWYNTTHTYIPGIPSEKHGTPGWGGNTFFSAHVNWDQGRLDAPFKNLYLAQAGDQVVVEMAGGPSYTYEVFAIHRYAIGEQYVNASAPKVVDMGAIIRADNKPAGEEWVTLMTCSCDAGRFANGECFDRDVVYAKRVK